MRVRWRRAVFHREVANGIRLVASTSNTFGLLGGGAVLEVQAQPERARLDPAAHMETPRRVDGHSVTRGTLEPDDGLGAADGLDLFVEVAARCEALPWRRRSARIVGDDARRLVGRNEREGPFWLADVVHVNEVLHLGEAFRIDVKQLAGDVVRVRTRQASTPDRRGRDTARCRDIALPFRARHRSTQSRRASDSGGGRRR